jgi:hypothetical protein
VGADGSAIAEGISETWWTPVIQSPLFKRLVSDELSVQRAMLLLRQCTVPKLNYLLRCLPPSLTQALASAFDRRVMAVAKRKLELGDRETAPRTIADYLLSAPLRHGGFGLTSAVLTAPAAFVASVASVAAGVPTPAFDEYSRSQTTLPAESLLRQWLQESAAELLEQVSGSTLLTDETAAAEAAGNMLPEPITVAQPLLPAVESFFPFFHTNPAASVDLQHKLVQQATLHQYNAALEQAIGQQDDNSTLTFAHLTSIAAPHASTWKTVLPISRQHVLSDSEYRIAARLNLGLAPQRNRVPDDCLSCGTLDVLRNDPWHHLSCSAHRSRQVAARHDAVAHVLSAAVQQAGGHATVEPRKLWGDDNRRPDLQIIFPAHHLLTDVVISHPLAPSHSSHCRRKFAAVAEQAAATKIHKYSPMADRLDARFLPFSLETTGGMSKHSQELVEQIVLASRDHLIMPTSFRLARSILAAVAVAVQRGNALCIQAGYATAVLRAAAGAA